MLIVVHAKVIIAIHLQQGVPLTSIGIHIRVPAIQAVIPQKAVVGTIVIGIIVLVRVDHRLLVLLPPMAVLIITTGILITVNVNHINTILLHQLVHPLLPGVEVIIIGIIILVTVSNIRLIMNVLNHLGVVD